MNPDIIKPHTPNIQLTEFLTASIQATKEIITLLDSKDNTLFVKHTQGVGGDISIGADLECQ